jgi:hypothetical protein
MNVDLVRALAELEDAPDLHAGRILVLLETFAGSDGTGRVEGLTKLAKLDFLLRYPTMLVRALHAKHCSSESVKVLSHEQSSVESRMVRYRFGPWDHRYRMLLNSLIARGLATVSIEGRTVSIGLTRAGLELAGKLGSADSFRDIARRAKTIRANFDLTATNLMRFVYNTFPEVLSLQKNEAIPP